MFQLQLMIGIIYSLQAYCPTETETGGKFSFLWRQVVEKVAPRYRYVLNLNGVVSSWRVTHLLGTFFASEKLFRWETVGQELADLPLSNWMSFWVSGLIVKLYQSAHDSFMRFFPLYRWSSSTIRCWRILYLAKSMCENHHRITR